MNLSILHCANMLNRGVEQLPPSATRQYLRINCSFLIPKNQRKHSLEQISTPIINLLQSWITPTQLTSECVLCTECLILLRNKANTISEGNLPLPAFGHKSVCFSCGNSILRVTRTYPVEKDRPERKFIVKHVLQHLISRLERVCSACWRKATREVHRHKQHDTNRSNLSEDAASTVPVKIPRTKTNIEVERAISDHGVVQAESATTDICTNAADEVISDCEGFIDCNETITEIDKSCGNIDEFLMLSTRKDSLPTTEQTKNNEKIDPVPAVLSHVTCDNCSKIIAGFRYKCLHCVDYHHCHECEMQEAHPNHYMIRMPKSPEFNIPEKIIDKMCNNFKATYISSGEENQRRESISCNEPVNNNSIACDTDEDLSEDIKILIRKEVTRIVRQKLGKKSQVIKAKQNLSTDTVNNNAPAVTEIGENDNVTDLVSKSNVDHDKRSDNESMPTIAKVVRDVTCPGAVNVEVSSDVSQLVIEMTKDGQKLIYKYVDS